MLPAHCACAEPGDQRHLELSLIEEGSIAENRRLVTWAGRYCREVAKLAVLYFTFIPFCEAAATKSTEKAYHHYCCLKKKLYEQSEEGKIQARNIIFLHFGDYASWVTQELE